MFSKKLFLAPILIILIAATQADTLNPVRVLPQNNFGTGEHLEYRVHYGFVNAAEAIVHVDNTIQMVNRRPCYKVEVNGRTTGAFDLVSRVRDTWRTYIDTAAILPQQFYERKQEGGYKKEEQLVFDHQNDVVRVKEINDPDGNDLLNMKVPDHVQDLISGYYFLRTVDFGKMQVGQIVVVKAFYDREVYDMKMRYGGKEEIETKFGKVNTLKINPILPKNKFFSGKEPISIWVSNDKNRVPLKASVELAIGAISLDIKKYSGLKTPLRFVQEEE
jgi:Protein of unknown function (DUF3108)